MRKLTEEQIAAWKAVPDWELAWQPNKQQEWAIAHADKLKDCWQQIQRKQLQLEFHSGQSGWWILEMADGLQPSAHCVNGMPMETGIIRSFKVPVLDWTEKFPEIREVEVVVDPHGGKVAWVCGDRTYLTHEELWDEEIEPAEWAEYFDYWLADYLALAAR